MSLSRGLAQRTGLYFGNGDGDESGPFVARIDIKPLPNGGVSIDDEATSREQGAQHREHSLLVAGPDGRDRLVIAHSESPMITDLVETTADSGRFEQVTSVGPYAMAVIIEQPDPDRITYAWWWAPVGQESVERSKADVRRT